MRLFSILAIIKCRHRHINIHAHIHMHVHLLAGGSAYSGH
jgi:hypothetical protein